MEDIIALAGGLIIVGAFLWFVGKVLSIWAETFSSTSPGPSRPAETENSGPDANGDHPDGMNEGDFHSGPGGYETGTAYPGTHYREFGKNRYPNSETLVR